MHKPARPTSKPTPDGHTKILLDRQARVISGLSFPAPMPLAGSIAMSNPVDVQSIGTEIAIRWDDGQESFITFATLRAASPSAEVRGERDIFGHQYGGEAPKDYRGVEVLGWERVGNYALRFDFSDGHRTGLYSFELLLKLGAPST